MQHKVGLQPLVSMLQMHQEKEHNQNICMRKTVNKKTHTLRMKEKNWTWYRMKSKLNLLQTSFVP